MCWHDGWVMEIRTECAVQAGAWDPRYAAVLAVASRGDIAAALIDTTAMDSTLISTNTRGTAMGNGLRASAEAPGRPVHLGPNAS